MIFEKIVFERQLLIMSMHFLLLHGLLLRKINLLPTLKYLDFSEKTLGKTAQTKLRVYRKQNEENLVTKSGIFFPSWSSKCLDLSV